MEEVIEEFGNIFAKTLRMLQVEIEENHESIHRLEDIKGLVEEWNNLYDKYFESEV